MFKMSKLAKEMDRVNQKRAAFDAERAKEMLAQKKEHERSASHRYRFLKETRCIPTPTTVYALWVATFIEQGGSISWSSGSNYMEPGIILSGGFGEGIEPLHAIPGHETPSYEDRGFIKWMPTTWSNATSIPTGYGALSLELMILPDMLSVSLANVSRSIRSHRPGWEWGHTQVFTLKTSESGPYGLDAWTNQPRSVNMHPDVLAILESSKPDELARNFNEEMIARPSRPTIAP